MHDQLQRVIDQFRPGFQSDGMDIALGRVDPAGTVEVKVLMGPNACEECLMPEDLLADMFRASMRDAMPNLARVAIVRETVAALPAAE